jgi:membrane associated rhomboid family serine protease
MFRNIPPAVMNLLIINGLVFLLLHLFPPLQHYFVLSKNDLLGFRHTCSYEGHTFYIDAAGRCNASMSPADFNSVQLVTCFFAHIDFLHILFNMLALVSIGGAIEMVMGSRRFMEFYLFCGVFASLAIAFLDPSNHPVLGASTSISGVLVAFALIFPRQQLILFPIPIPIRAQTLVFGAFALSLTLVILETRRIIAPSGVSHFGHLAGMVGAVFYFLFGRFIGLNK